MTETFICERCHGTFPKAWSDEEALAESRELYGDVPPEDLAVVCEDCFRVIMGVDPSDGEPT